MAAKGMVRESFRVVVVDDEEDMQRLVKDILQGVEDFSYAGSFSNGLEALSGLSELCPDVVLMDIRLPDLNGIECTRRLKHVMPGLKIIMLSGLHDVHSINASLQAGAVGYLAKPITPDYCLVNLRVAVSRAAGIKSVSPDSELVPSGVAALENRVRLTKRENEVLEGLAKGLPYKGIADNLGISFSAVHWHANNAYRKLGVTNRTEAILELSALA